MELDPTCRALLLVVPIYTGKYNETVLSSIILDEQLMHTYGNSSILVSFLDVSFDYNNNIYVYNCYHDIYRDENVNANINNIANEKMLVKNASGKVVPANGIVSTTANVESYTIFVGFASSGNVVHAVFA